MADRPPSAAIGVDIGTQSRKAVGSLVVDGAAVAIAGWEIGSGDPRAFGEAIVELARECGRSTGLRPVIVIEDQHVKLPQVAKKLIEARMWVKILATLAGFEVVEVLASVWQADVFTLTPIKGTKHDRKTKEKALDVAAKVWPCLTLTEDQIDAVLIALWRLRLRGRARASKSSSRRRLTGPTA